MKKIFLLFAFLLTFNCYSQIPLYGDVHIYGTLKVDNTPLGSHLDSLLVIQDGIFKYIQVNSFAWSLLGNSGTTESNFLGTTDIPYFNIRVNNIPFVRIESDSNNIFFGNGAGFNNKHKWVLAIGDSAGAYNTKFNVVAIGRQAGYKNSGDNSVFIGVNAGNNNTSGGVVLIGGQSGQDNVGIGLNAIGANSGQNNAGDNVNAFGNQSCANNAGDNVNAFSNSSCENNTGNNIIALGNTSCKNNTGNNVIALGDTAASDNNLNNSYWLFKGDSLTTLFYGRSAESGNPRLRVNGDLYVKDNLVLENIPFTLNSPDTNLVLENNVVKYKISKDTNYVPISFRLAIEDSINSDSLIRTVTKAQADALILANALKKGVTYKITGVNTTLYGGTTIFLQALSDSTFSSDGVGIFYNPWYNQAIDGFGVWSNRSSFDTTSTTGLFVANETVTTNRGGTGTLIGNIIFGLVILSDTVGWNGSDTLFGATDTCVFHNLVLKTYSIGDSVFWGGKKWINVNGNIGSAVDELNLNNEWVVVPYSSSDYNISLDKIKYDYLNDFITYREDIYSNIVECTYYNYSNQFATVNPINHFQWGNGITSSGNGISNNRINNSLVDIVNFYGRYFLENTFNNFSTSVGNLYLSSVTVFSNFFDKSYFNSNVFIAGGGGSGFTFFNNRISNLSSFSNCKFAYSGIESCVLNGEYLNGGMGYGGLDNLLWINSTIQFSTIDYSIIQNNYSDNNIIKNISLVNESAILNGYYKNSTMSIFILENESFFTNDTIIDSYINNINLNNRGRFIGNHIYSSTIEFVNLTNNTHIEANNISGSTVSNLDFSFEDINYGGGFGGIFGCKFNGSYFRYIKGISSLFLNDTLNSETWSNFTINNSIITIPTTYTILRSKFSTILSSKFVTRALDGLTSILRYNDGFGDITANLVTSQITGHAINTIQMLDNDSLALPMGSFGTMYSDSLHRYNAYCLFYCDSTLTATLIQHTTGKVINSRTDGYEICLYYNAATNTYYATNKSGTVRKFTYDITYPIY